MGKKRGGGGWQGRRCIRICTTPCNARGEAPQCTVDISLSVVEIYCERIRDLLCGDQPAAAGGAVGAGRGDNLAVAQDRERGLLVISSAVERPVQSLEQVHPVPFWGFVA